MNFRTSSALAGAYGVAVSGTMVLTTVLACVYFGRQWGWALTITGAALFKLPAEYKVPHMGWNQLQFRKRSPVLNGVEDGAHFYFVHSYYVVPRDRSVIATETDYGAPFCSSIWRDNLYAAQFHPEKSQSSGLRLLKNFAELR